MPVTGTRPTDEAWAEVARHARTALDHLGYGVKLDCLPGDLDPCGGTFAQHCVSYFAAIRAIADHQMQHLGVGLQDRMASDIYDRTLQVIRDRCQLEGH